MCTRFPLILLSFGALALVIPNAQAQQVRRAIEFTQGPVIASNRLIGLGGAFVSIAEGADANLINPASFAIRYPHTRDDFFDWDFSLYWMNHVSESNTSPEVGIAPELFSASNYLGVGLNLQFGRLGGGFHLYSKDYTYTREDGESYVLSQILGVVGLGLALPWQDVTLGLGLSTAQIGLRGSIGEDILRLEGVGFVAGGHWAPLRQPFRMGVSYHSSVLAAQTDFETSEGLDWGVSGMHVPARVSFGASWMGWERIYNPAVTRGNGEEMDDTSARRFVLVSADISAEMPTPVSVSPASFIESNFVRSGEFVAWTPRLGVESEFVANRLVGRVGSYFEPSRIQTQDGRIHATLGADVRLNLIWDWKLSVGIDVAHQYSNWGLGLGIWR